jgi:HUS1 checkpoint protein
MRFKAKLAPEQVSLLYSLIVPLARLSSNNSSDGAASVWLRNGSVLWLDSDHLRISCKGKSQDTDGITCFAELKAGGGIFLEHRIESTADSNMILMELDLGQLKVALQSVNEKSSQPLEQRHTVLKLAKRNNIPCLCVEALSAGMVQVHHAIPIRILRTEDRQYHLPPQIAIPDVQLQIPRDKPLRAVLENFRSMDSTTVYVQGNRRTGELTVSLDSEGASIRTYFGKLTPLLDDNCSSENEECTVKVDVRKLSAALQWQQHASAVSSALMCLVENEQLVLHVTLDPAIVGFFTYYVPVHFMSSDD